MEQAERTRLQEQMTRLADGDRSAFDSVFESLFPLMTRFVGSQFPLPDADDVVSQSLLKIFERASEFNPELDALAWALGIAGYEIRTAKRKIWRRRENGISESTLEQVDSGKSPEDLAISHNLQLALAEVLETLRPRDIETISLIACGERPDVAGATFRKRVERALTRFRLAWRTKHGP